MEWVDRFIRLTSILGKTEIVTRFNQGENVEAATVAHGLLDMEESFLECVKLIHSLEENPDTEQIDNILLDIELELMHILYHINDMQVFNNRVEATIESSNNSIAERNKGKL